MQSILIVLLTIAAVTAEDTFCTPGALFKIDCNTCTCSDDGRTAACTDMLCPKEKIMHSSEIESVKTDPKTVCTPRSQFKDYCNTCFCADDGLSFACTRMMCDKEVWNRDGTLKITVQHYTSERLEPKQVCEPLSQFKDYCNTCFCADDGLSYSCTRMMCDKEIWNRDGSLKVTPQHHAIKRSVSKQVCTPLSQFKDYCNTCFCADDGLSFSCTRMMCDHEIWNKDGTQKITPKFEEDAKLAPKQVCVPRSQFKDYCNTCTCADDGLSFACTRMMCDKEIWNRDGSLKIVSKSHQLGRSASKQVCKPRSQFKDYCNTCTCADDGSSFACTRMMCDKTIWNKDGSLKYALETSKVANAGKVCEAGSVFSPDGCNTCICDEYGTHFACTLKLCLSTLKHVYGVEGTEKWGPVYKQGDACTPGKAFYSECNRCVCTNSGKSAFCTFMTCQAFA